MKLFSKRNKISTEREDFAFRHTSRFSRRRNELVGEQTRNRLVSEIRYLTSNNDFLEWFILFENQRKEKIFFEKGKLDSFSLAELGYRISDFFVFEDFAIIEQKSDDDDDGDAGYFDDAKLFDLVEITIVFAKEKKREEVISRFNAIFNEEESRFHIANKLITKKSGEDIRSLSGVLKDENLKSKVNLFYSFEPMDYVSAAKVSTEILNILFSDYIKDGKKREIKKIRENLIVKLFDGSKSKRGNSEKKARLNSYLESLLDIAKDLDNDIYDVRHTEKSTIEVKNSNFYKLIARLNISIAELALTTLKDDFILGEDWEEIKNNYIKKYKIDRETRLVIRKPNELPTNDSDDEIKPEDIPF